MFFSMREVVLYVFIIYETIFDVYLNTCLWYLRLWCARKKNKKCLISVRLFVNIFEHILLVINRVGLQTRRRPCMNQYNRPIEIQNICPGKDTESKACYNKKCVTNGQWSSWRQWSACDLMSCRRSRIRSCVKDDKKSSETR